MSHIYILSNRKWAVVLAVLLSFPVFSFAQDGMRVGSNSAPLEVLHVDGAILLGNTSNNNLGTIRWNGTEFEGRTASGWVSLSSSSYTHPTQVAIDADAVNNGINVIDRIQVNTLGHVTSVTARDLSVATTSAAGVMSAADKTKLDGIATGATANAGTVTTVSVTTANGVSGTVANPTTTPAISLSLGAITPTSVAASGTVAGSNLSGTNTGDQTITLTSDVTGSGTGSFATTIANDVVTNAKLNNMATSTIKGRTTAGTGDPEDLTPAQVTTMLGLDDAITGTGTANKVAFWTGANTLDDDIDLHWVSATNRLGIGEDAPDFGLHVTGTGTNQGPGSNDNVIARFEQPTTSSGMGIQLVGYRAQAQTSSFVDFKNYSADVTAEYKLGRVAGVNEDDSFKGALGFFTNPGTTVESLTERMRINSTGTITIDADGTGAGGSYTLPAQRGTNGQVLGTDGSGNTSWQNAPVPAGAVMYFNLAGCPAGWSELTAGQGRYAVGRPSGGTLGATVGTALSNQENRATGQHLHAVDPPNTTTTGSGGHNHDFHTANNDVNSVESQGYPAGNYHGAFRTTDRRQISRNEGTILSVGDHTHAVDITSFDSANAGSVAGTNAPYIQLLMCEKD